MVHVDLSRQLVTVYRNGVRIGVSTASTGRRGYETPTGVFTVLQKKQRHRSNRYNNAPMPYMIRLTWDGVALHGGAVGGRPVSHGCIRLPMQFARELFHIVPFGGVVVVVGDAAAPAEGQAAGVLAPFGVGGWPETREPLRPGQSYSWRPSVSPFGPVTIVMSLSDQQVVVVRNGVEIGRARASFASEARSTRVLTRTEDAQWVQIPAAGQEDAAATTDSTILERARLPPQFHAAVQAAAAPGTTILLTHARVVVDEAVLPAPGIAEGTGPPDGGAGATVPVFDMER
jgi:lipoprotein-anchoring transpeptidase ErfK/SrfK